VDRDWLRFDFDNPRALAREDLETIEAEVNARVIEADSVRWTIVPKEEARAAGAMMLFGEKYPDMVRMVTMGQFSKELCGGTHLDNTGQIGLFKITGEESVAAGIRRITALTGPAAIRRVQEDEAALHELALLLKIPTNELPARVAAMSKELRELKKQASAAPKKGGVSADDLLAAAVDVAGAKVVVAEVPGGTPPLMRQLIDQMRKKNSRMAILLAGREQEKVSLVAGISEDLETKGIHAGEWIRAAAHVVGGSGGGRPDMAQAGGKTPEKLPAALDEARKEIQRQLSGQDAPSTT
jgi:alanyl-tRNA synthetase